MNPITKKLFLSFLIYYICIYLILNIILISTQSTTVKIGFGESVLFSFHFLTSSIDVTTIPFPYVSNLLVTNNELSPIEYLLYSMLSLFLYYISLIGVLFKFRLREIRRYFQIKIIKIAKNIIFDKDIKLFKLKDVFIFLSFTLFALNIVFFTFSSFYYSILLYTFNYYELGYLTYISVIFNIYIIYKLMKLDINIYKFNLFRILLFLLPKTDKMYIFNIDDYYSFYHIEVGKFNYEIFNRLLLEKNTIEQNISAMLSSSDLLSTNNELSVIQVDRTHYERYIKLKKSQMKNIYKINNIYQKLNTQNKRKE